MKLVVDKVSKSFGEIRALDKVCLTFDEPKIYGLLGRNGAGKSTLLNIITEHIFPDSGSVTIDGEAVGNKDELLSKMHFMSEVDYYGEDLKFKDAVKYAADFYGKDFDVQQAHRYAKLFKLNENQKLSKLSTGYKSIFKCSLALAMDVPFVFFDEPVLGLDANHRDLFYKLLIEDFERKPKNLVISTHLIEEVAPLIEEFIIIRNGRILLKKSAESMATYASSVTGPKVEVEAFVVGKQVLGRSAIGALETAYIVGQPKEAAGLTVQNLEIQRLFIELTNDYEEARV